MLNKEVMNITNEYLGMVYELDDFEAHGNLWKAFETAKSEQLAKLFGDKLIIEKEVVIKKELRDIRRELEEEININGKIHQALDTEWRKIAEGYYPAWSVNSDSDVEMVRRSETWQTLRYAFQIDALSKGEIQKDYIAYHPITGKKIKIQKGSKPMRVLKNFISDTKALDEIQTVYSRVMNTKTIRGVLCLSIHPLDYLTVSVNKSNWSSCYNTLDSGAWCASTLSLISSPNTMVAYLKADKDVDYNGIEWNNKRWRVYVSLNHNNELVHCGRQYPYSSEALLAETVMMTGELTGREYSNGDCEAGRVIIETPYNMYNDASCSGDLTTFITKDWKEEDEVIQISDIGSVCPICGDHYHDTEFSITCDGCYRGEKCEDCGCAMNEDNSYWIESLGIRVCECCVDDNYSWCEHCDEYHPNDNTMRIFTEVRPDAGEKRWYGVAPNYYEQWFCEGCVDSMIDSGTQIVCEDCGMVVPVDSIDEEGRCRDCQ